MLGRLVAEFKDLSREYEQINEVGDMRSLITNDL